MRISVVCAVFNTPPELLKAAIQSVIASAEPFLQEIILVDDVCTHPDTISAIEEIAALDDRVIVLRPTCNVGPGSARNLGIRAASAEWIGFIDSDDLWIPEAVKAMFSILADFPEARWIAGNYASQYEDGRTEGAPLISEACSGTRLNEWIIRLRAPELTRLLIANSWLRSGSSLIRREVLLQIDGFYENIGYHEDCILWVRLSLVSDLYFAERDVYLYRRRPSSVMASSSRLTEAYATGWHRARVDPLLKFFRRELRWCLYGVYKGLALNNLLNGNYGQGLRFALKAFLLDPREIRELILFLSLVLCRNRVRTMEEGLKYSRAERFSAA